MLLTFWAPLIILIFICLLYFFKIYMKSTIGVYNGDERIDGKTVIVTGASAGIGVETAKDLARRGGKVIMLCRDLVKGEKVRQSIIASTGNKDISLKHVDFASLASIRKCANELLAEEPRIDILVNNAGAAFVDIHKITEDGLNLLMQTNHFGSFLLTNILLGRIKESAPSRIVNLTSYMYRFAYLDLNDLQQDNVRSKGTHYSNTKLANIYFTTVLAEKLKGTGVTVNYVHPGVIATEITRNYNKLIDRVNAAVINIFFKNVWEGAQTTIYVCVSPSVANVTGKYFKDCREVTPGDVVLDFNKATKLWELSEKAVKLQKDEKHY